MNAYKFLRTVEHRLQMVADDQTHTLPADREELERFARFAGYKDRDAFADVLLGHMRKVQRAYAGLFEDTTRRSELGTLSFPEKADDRETLDRLGEMGYRQPLEVSATVRRWSTPGCSTRARAPSTWGPPTSGTDATAGASRFRSASARRCAATTSTCRSMAPGWRPRCSACTR